VCTANPIAAGVRSQACPSRAPCPSSTLREIRRAAKAAATCARPPPRPLRSSPGAALSARARPPLDDAAARRAAAANAFRLLAAQVDKVPKVDKVPARAPESPPSPTPLVLGRAKLVPLGARERRRGGSGRGARRGKGRRGGVFVKEGAFSTVEGRVGGRVGGVGGGVAFGCVLSSACAEFSSRAGSPRRRARVLPRRRPGPWRKGARGGSP